MKEIIKITDYDVILTLLVEEYKEKPKFKAILESMNFQANDLETALFEIRDNFWIATAEGDQLDILGALQGEARQGLSDTEYRKNIQAKIIINNSSGQFESIITGLTELFGATVVQMMNATNATLSIWTDITITDNMFQQLLTWISSGVKICIVYGSLNPFVFLDDPDGSGFTKLTDDYLVLNSGDSLVLNNNDTIRILLNTVDTAYGGELQAVKVS